MTYRAPLLNADGHLGDPFKLLTDAQLARLAEWSIIKERDVLTLLRQAKFMAVEYNGNQVMLEGMLPHCGLYGGMLPDGSTHT